MFGIIPPLPTPLDIHAQLLAEMAYWISVQWLPESNQPISNDRYTIHRVYQPSTGIRAVLKMTKSANERVISLIKEQQFLHNLHHPNIVPLVAHGEYFGRPFILTHLCERGSAIDFINNIPAGCDRGAAVRHFFRQLIRGLSFLHANKVTHGDIKPANLLIDQDFNLMICDFEFARYNEKPGKVACESSYGTLNYMAPEIFHKKKYCPFAADIWMAGTTLLFLLNRYRWKKPTDEDRKFKDFFSWKETKKPTIFNMKPDEEEALTGMIDVDPAKRMFIEEIKSTRWYMEE